jgi:hypothetical protein
VLEDYLRSLELWHFHCATYHFQTDDKLERGAEPLRTRLEMLVFTRPEALRAAIAKLIEFSDYRQYQGGVRNTTPLDFYSGRWEEMPNRRKEENRQP